MTTTDLVETRRLREKLTMRWPRNADTTIRLRRLMVADKPLPWWRKFLRWLKSLSN